MEPPEGFAFEQGRAAPLVIENTPGDPEKGTLEVRSLAVGDLNGDGFSDLVAAYYRGNLNPLDWSYLAVIRGNGDGTFENPTSYPLPDAKSPGVRGLVLGDFDDDDDLDVVVSVPDQPEVRFFPNDGTGALGTPVFTPMASGPDDLVAADVDGDGVLDLVTVNPNDDSVSFLAGAGDGTFDIPVDVTTGDAPYSVAVGDFDGQNGLDLAAGTWAGRRVYVFLHDGGGGFGPPVSLLPFGTAGRPHKLWADDFTGDGATDLVAAGPATVPGCPECLVTLPGDGAGNFTVPDPAVTPEAFTPIENMGLRNTGSVDGYPTPPSDVDGDGDLDVVLNHYDQDVVTIARNDGAGRFATDVWAPGSGSDADFPATEDNFGQHYRDLSQSLAVWPDDLDGDGAIDLAVAFDPARFRPGGIVILDGDPSSPGRLRAPEVFGAGSQLNFADNAGDVLAVADWDENGTQDVVFLNRSPGRLGYLPGAGDGTFGEPVIDTVPFGPCTAGRDFTLTDVDRDTHLDLVCRDGGVLYGDGTGGVSEAVTIGTVSAFLTRANSLGVDDFDGDDDLDVVLTSTDGSGNVVARVFRQDSSTREWSEADPVTLGVGSAPVLEVGDVDGDDDIDVVAHLTGTLGSVARLVTVRNNGDATFAAPEVSNDAGFPAGSLVLGLELGDVDGDDDLDPVLFRDSRDDDEGSVAPRLNDGSGVFADPVEHRASPRHSTRLVDIDGDGALDAAANSTAFGLEVLPGNGDGSFGAPLRFTAGEARPGGIDFGDLDGDDDLDAVVSRTANPSPPAQSVVALLREGTGVPPSGEPDLAVDEVTAPDEVEPGAPAEISYTARNDGDGPADGSWTDSVWLSADDTWDLDDRLLGTVPRSGVLAAGAEYTETVEAPFDPLLSGDHTVIVRADSRDLLDESTETNNDGRSPPVTLDIPTLDVGSDLDLTLEDGRAHYVQLPVAEGQSTLFELLAPVGDIATVDLVRDRVPVPARDIVLPDPASTTRQVALPPDGAGTWFVRLLGRDAAGTGTDVTVRASDLPFGILGVDPDEGSNRGTATLTIDGVGFDPSTRPLLVADDDTVVAPIAPTPSTGRRSSPGSTSSAQSPGSTTSLPRDPTVIPSCSPTPSVSPTIPAGTWSSTRAPRHGFAPGSPAASPRPCATPAVPTYPSPSSASTPWAHGCASRASSATRARAWCSAPTTHPPPTGRCRRV
ncbi:MAG: FG-GAP-like repeat-containing protein [Acidimicrobiia bacterium]|nr:FG-GAP-like repeat-containing protein [Acidimicrobiia bacterium]